MCQYCWQYDEFPCPRCCSQNPQECDILADSRDAAGNLDYGVCCSCAASPEYGHAEIETEDE